VAARLETARRVLKEHSKYDATVVNDTVEGAVRGILAHLGLQAPGAPGENPSDN
jgi:guanylate kinase